MRTERERPGRPPVGSGPPGPGPLQRQRVPRGHARLLPGPGGALQRQLPLRRRGAALPAQRRQAPRPSSTTPRWPRSWPRCCPPSSRRPTCSCRWPTNRATTSLPGAVDYEDGAGRLVPRGRPGRALARRPLHPLHRRHHRHAQGRAVAPARHLHGRHGRAAGRHLGDRHQLRGHHRAAGRQRPLQADAPAPAHARRGPVGRLHADGPGGHPRLPRRPPPARPRRRLAHGRAREGQHHDHRGRRHAAPAGRRSSTRPTTTSRPSSPWATAGRPSPRPCASWPWPGCPKLVISRLGRDPRRPAPRCTWWPARTTGRELPPRTRARWWWTRSSTAVLAAGPRGHRLAGPDRQRCPSGYLGDAEKTARTFPVIDGVRYSIPGDRARHLADGQIELLGRDSVTINSGGEKIFVEEVERAIAGHPAVADVVVTGRPSERWGQEVVAVVQLAEGGEATGDAIVDHAVGSHRPLQAAQGRRLRAGRSSGRRRARPTTAGPAERGAGARRAERRGTVEHRAPGPAALAGRRTSAPFAALNADPRGDARTFGLAADPGRERRPGRPLRRRAWTDEGGASGRSRWPAEPPSSAWSGLHRCSFDAPVHPGASRSGGASHRTRWGRGYATEAAAGRRCATASTTGGLAEIVARSRPPSTAARRR